MYFLEKLKFEIYIKSPFSNLSLHANFRNPIRNPLLSATTILRRSAMMSSGLGQMFSCISIIRQCSSSVSNSDLAERLTCWQVIVCGSGGRSDTFLFLVGVFFDFDELFLCAAVES